MATTGWRRRGLRAARAVRRDPWTVLTSVIAAVSVVAALSGLTRLALAGIAVLAWSAVVVLVRSARRVDAGDSRSAAATARLKAQEQAQLRMDANIRRILAAVERARLESADEIAELSRSLDPGAGNDVEV